MAKRLMTCTPSELLALTPEELLEALRGSEGRCVYACARSRGPNLIQGVTNAEACAAMGADLVKLCYYDPDDPMFPGLPSKDPGDDVPFRAVQLPVGRGWRAREIRRLIGRPISVELFVEQASPARMDRMLEEGFDIICIYGFEDDPDFLPAIKILAQKARGRALVEAGILHGPKLKRAPRHMRDLQTPEFTEKAVAAGANLFQVPAVGTLPGFTMEHVTRLIDAVHEAGGVAITGIHSSLEGSDDATIRRIAVDNKICGADIQMIGDAGINENMASPELILALSIALKGKRHTYRRMCQSVLR